MNPKLDGFGSVSMKGSSVILRASSMLLSAILSKFVEDKEMTRQEELCVIKSPHAGKSLASGGWWQSEEASQ